MLSFYNFLHSCSEQTTKKKKKKKIITTRLNSLNYFSPEVNSCGTRLLDYEE